MNMDYEKVLKQEAKTFAQKYGLDENRVYTVMKNINTHITYEDNHLYTGLHEAVKYIQPIEALKLLEAEDVHLIMQRVHNFNLITLIDFPFYSLEQMSEITSDFITHLENNEELWHDIFCVLKEYIKQFPMF